MVKKNEYESGTYWDQLSTEQLEDILRADIASPNQMNDEAVFHILEVLEKREKENPSGRLPDVDQAWQEFQKYYNIPEGEGQSLYPIRNDQEKRSVSVPTKTRRVFRPRKILVVAAVLILMFGGMLTAQAAGVDVLGAIGHWTEEIFQFKLPVNHNDLSGETDYILRNASQDLGIPSSITPVWYPDGFTAKTPVSNSVEDFVDSIICEYTNKDESYVVKISQYYNSADVEATLFEKDDSDVVTYQSAKGTFYIFSNLDTLTATWSDGRLSITIAGDLQLEEIEKIIDSIGE